MLAQGTRQNPVLEKRDHLIIGQFRAMASPCEVLIETTDPILAQDLIQQAADEAWRIEEKFSRYRDDNIIYQINHANGDTLSVDEETARLLDFAGQCYQISEGLFDITSGILGQVWKFDGSDHIPRQDQIDPLLQHIGWQRTTWNNPEFTLPSGMQVDFGGIGKEYAVDRVLMLLQSHTDRPLLVNFGGDLHASGPQTGNRPWITGLDNPIHPGAPYDAVKLFHGALATSGDAFRFLQKDGVRYSHVLNPFTGWPVMDAPHSITVAAACCVEAGLLSTLALLQGKNAEQFLSAQNIKFWVSR